MEIQDPFTTGGEQDIIFPYGKIPIDKSTCPTTTCEALQSVALKSDVASSIKCKTDEVCSGVECLANVFGTGLLFPVLTRVLPCNKPPAVYFLLRHPGEEGKPIIEQTISKNTTIRVFSFEIHIRLDQLENAIGLRVSKLRVSKCVCVLELSQYGKLAYCVLHTRCSQYNCCIAIQMW